MNLLTKTNTLRWLLMTSLAALILSSCQKELEPAAAPPLEQASKAGVHGHLQQTKTFSDDVVLKWMNLHLRIQQTTSPESARRMGYIGVALYESVVPGMPAYRPTGRWAASSTSCRPCPKPIPVWPITGPPVPMPRWLP